MSSAWKDLPEELSGPERDLAGELRAIKDAAGLSLSELASRTHYSRASWERWLNGKRSITEQALEALIGAVACDGPALRTLWRLAVEERPKVSLEKSPAEASAAADAQPAAEPVAAPDAEPGAVPGAEPAAEPSADEPGPVPAWWRRPAVLVSSAVALAALLVLAGLNVGRQQDDDGSADAARPVLTPTASPTVTPPSPVPTAATCQALGCAHKDPKNTGCGRDARTLATTVIGKVVVYLRYSRICEAAWSAITEGEPKDYATITDTTGDSETALIHYGYDNYSPMLSAADPAIGFQVCGFQPSGHDCTLVISNLAMVVDSTPIPIGKATPPPGTGAGASTTPAVATPGTPSIPATVAPQAPPITPAAPGETAPAAPASESPSPQSR
ncbi:DUF2690 domain-containing protein [Kitasatospora sp. NPDC051170]|uniref:helix-turn-helix domain-containing protein n=1 Tax=Kitasatospora sp. NPDC051170 TaxID=3364056 RepID=UPI00379DB505